jgi:hypothetical protein
MAEHLRTCIRCQAELAGYKRLLKVLHSLDDEPGAFPAFVPALAAETLGAVQRRLAVHRRRPNEIFVAAGAVAALGVAALGVGAVLARAARQSRALAGVAS